MNTKITIKEANGKISTSRWVNDETPLSADNMNVLLDGVRDNLKSIDGIDSSVKALGERVTTLETQSGTGGGTPDDYEELRSDVDALDGSIKRLQTSVNLSIRRLEDSKANLDEYGKVVYNELPTVEITSISTEEELIDKIPTAKSTQDELDLKLEGSSTKYYLVKKGWHRVLNTIRGNGGRLNLTLSDGRSLQSLEIDLSGFVKLGITSPEPEESGYVFCKSNSSFLGPKQTFAHNDPYFKYKITAVRMGYASDEALNESEEVPYDPTANGPRSVNCYVDVFIDRNISDEDASNIDAQMLIQFTGKSYQHNCYPIKEETTDSNYKTTVINSRFPEPTPITLQYGMYGEPLSFINIPIRDDYDIAEEGYKKKLADNFYVKLGEDTTPSALNVEHNLTNISSITFNNSESLDSSSYRFFRKYNMLSAFFATTSTGTSRYKYDWLSVYNWEGGNPTDRFNGGNILSAFRSGKKTTADGKVAYGMTTSGTLMFTRISEDALTDIFKTFNIYYNNTGTDCVILPKGTYMTNVSDIFYTDELSKPTKYSAKTGNSVGNGRTPANKCFILTEPMYLTTARLTISKTISKETLEIFTPFLIKVPDEIKLGSVDNNGVCEITDDIWKNFSIRSNILENIPEGQTAFAFAKFVGGWLELTEEGKKYDSIKITDIDGKEIIIKHFSDFYTSWRASGECEIPADGIIKENSVDNKLIQTYDLFADKSENPYDTLFTFNGLTLVEGNIYNNDIIDIKSLAEKVKVSQVKPENLPDNSVWVKPLTQEIIPPAVYIKKAGSIKQGETIDGTYYINSDDTFDIYVNASAEDFVDNGVGACMVELKNLPFNIVNDYSLMAFGNVFGDDTSPKINVSYSLDRLFIVPSGPFLPMNNKDGHRLNAHIRGKIL